MMRGGVLPGLRKATTSTPLPPSSPPVVPNRTAPGSTNLNYRVTMLVKDYVSFPLFLRFPTGNCSAISAQFETVQAELGRQWNNQSEVNKT